METKTRTSAMYLRALPQVKSLEKMDGQYRVTLEDGWKVYPSQDYSFPVTATRFHHSSTLQGIEAFVSRAETTRREQVLSMRELATGLGAELAARISQVLAQHKKNMTVVQEDNFPRIVLAEIAKRYNQINE